MAEEEGDIEFSHLSWHAESSILSSDPLARFAREASTSTTLTPNGHSLGGSIDSSTSSHIQPHQQRDRIAPSLINSRLVRNANTSSELDSSGPPRGASENTSGQLAVTVEPSASATQNLPVSVDERSLNFAQFVQQADKARTKQSHEREAQIKLRRAAAEKVQPTLDALRSWDDGLKSERLLSWGEIDSCASLFSRLLGFHKPGLPSKRQLIDLVHHYHPPRGQIPIHVCDFGNGRASHFETTLGNIEKCWDEKPSWAVVRWIIAPLNKGLTHSSVEDLFRHADTEPWAFKNVAGPSWPYIACGTLSLEQRDTYQTSRDVCILANKVKGLASELDRTTFAGDKNANLKGDIEWRAKHLGSRMGFLDLAQSDDIGFQLSDGRGIGYNGPGGGVKYLEEHLDEQILPKDPFYKSAQIVRSPFRCFHRNDGVLLTMSSMRGVNYLDKDLSSHLQEPPESLFYNPDASVLGHVWNLFAETGTSS